MKSNLVRHALLGVFLAIITLAIAAPPKPVHSGADNVYFDMVVNDARGELYGVNTDAGIVDIISTASLTVIDTVWVGGAPQGIDLAPGGDEVAVALKNSAKIAIIDLDTRTISGYMVPGGVSNSKPYDVVYGRPGRLYSTGASGSFGFDYLHVFNTGTNGQIDLGSDILRNSPRLAIAADDSTLFALEHNSVDNVDRYDVSSEPITRTHFGGWQAWNGSNFAVSSDGNYLYSSSGNIESGDVSTQLGTFDLTGHLGALVRDHDIGYAHAAERVFISIVYNGDQSRLIEFDGITFAKLREYVFPYDIKAPRASQDGRTIYVSTEVGVQAFPANYQYQATFPAVVNTFCLVDYSDDFSNVSSGWPLINDDFLLTEYLGGQYRVFSRQAGYFYFLRAPHECQWQDYNVSVDAEWRALTGNSYGLLFGIQGGFDTFYLFDVNADLKMARLLFFNGSSYESIIDPTYSDEINQGEAVNRLRAEVYKSDVKLFINGAWVFWATDELVGLDSPASVGVISSSYSNAATSDARFDNFSWAAIETTGVQDDGPRAARVPALGYNNAEPIPLPDLAWPGDGDSD